MSELGGGDAPTDGVGLDRGEWSGREYELLSAHYFYEDDAYFKTQAFFTTLSAALLAFSAAQFDEPGRLAGVAILAIFGLVLTAVWLVSLIRIRAWRNAMEARIEEIERALHAQWGADKTFAPALRRDAESRVANASRHGVAAVRAVSRVSASGVMLLVPCIVAVLWVGIAIYSLVR
jgi:hypothetical protein